MNSTNYDSFKLSAMKSVQYYILALNSAYILTKDAASIWYTVVLG